MISRTTGAAGTGGAVDASYDENPFELQIHFLSLRSIRESIEILYWKTRQ